MRERLAQRSRSRSNDVDRPRLALAPISVNDEPIAAGSLEVQVIDPAREGTWDDLVATHPQSSVFHSSAWAKVLMNTYGY